MKKEAPFGLNNNVIFELCKKWFFLKKIVFADFHLSVNDIRKKILVYSSDKNSVSFFSVYIKCRLSAEILCQ